MSTTRTKNADKFVIRKTPTFGMRHRNNSPEYDPENQKDEDMNCCQIGITSAQNKVISFYKEYSTWIWKSIAIVAFLLYLAYFGYAMHWQFGDEGSIRLLAGTIFGVFLIVMNLVWGSIKVPFEACGCLFSNTDVAIRMKILRWVMYVLCLVAMIAILVIEVAIPTPDNLISLAGLAAFIILCFITSTNPGRVDWHPVFWGLALQFFFAAIILRRQWGYDGFKWLGDRVTEFLAHTNVASKFVFDNTEAYVFVFAECSCGTSIVPGTTPDPNPLLFPVPKRDKAFLTIGIPTIKRKGASYYAHTIKSLVSNMSPEERKEVLIVVLLADTDPTVKAELSGDIRRNFSDAIDAGMLHVIQAPSSYYPNLTITKFTYGQEKHYIQWRAKQNFDYAFMFEYSLDISKYYMQIEDDVITVDGYIGAIKQYIAEQPDTAWTCLEFSELGFIGKLYKNSDLQKLASLLKLFYEEQPVDYTYLYFNMLNTQMVQRLRKPTLFQHQGIHSSYPGKIQPLKDRFFDQMTKLYKGDNPPAEVFTSMKSFLTFLPRLAYEKTEGYFWTHGSPSDGDSFTIVFQEPHRLRRVIIDTGSVGHPEDRLLSGHLEASLTLLKTEVNIQCMNDIMIGEFKDGRIDVDALEESIKFKAMCLRVKITKHQEPWLIVREIAVFTAA